MLRKIVQWHAAYRALLVAVVAAHGTVALVAAPVLSGVLGDGAAVDEAAAGAYLAAPWAARKWCLAKW